MPLTTDVALFSLSQGQLVSGVADIRETKIAVQRAEISVRDFLILCKCICIAQNCSESRHWKLQKSMIA